MCGFCNVWVCVCGFCNVGVCMCGFCNVCSVLYILFSSCQLALFWLPLIEVFPCFFLSCKANARVQLTDGAWPALFPN
jgi:hypothetical protein